MEAGTQTRSAGEEPAAMPSRPQQVSALSSVFQLRDRSQARLSEEERKRRELSCYFPVYWRPGALPVSGAPCWPHQTTIIINNQLGTIIITYLSSKYYWGWVILIELYFLLNFYCNQPDRQI